jgi:hypothetical protein
MPIPVLQIIEFLVSRKFPLHKAIRGGVAGFSAEDRQRQIREIDDYETELLDLPSADLYVRHEQEKAMEAQEFASRAAREESERPFNKAYSNADFAHWAKAAYWSLDEALALIYGKEPAHAKWETVQKYVQVSPFARQYARARDLIHRAKNVRHLTELVQPGVFLAWAKRNDLPVPPELEQEVTTRGQLIRDWKSVYDELSTTTDSLAAQAKATMESNGRLVASLEGRIEGLKQEREQLTARVGELESVKMAAEAAQRPLSGKERDSALRLILGMAVACYKHDPLASRTSTATEITKDLATLGISIDPDTVRKWLNEAGDTVEVHLPERQSTKPK